MANKLTRGEPASVLNPGGISIGPVSQPTTTEETTNTIAETYNKANILWLGPSDKSKFGTKKTGRKIIIISYPSV